MPNGNNNDGDKNCPPGSSTEGSITRPPQILAVIAGAAAMGALVGALLGTLLARR